MGRIRPVRMAVSNPVQTVELHSFAPVLARALAGALVGGVLIATLEFAVTRVSIPAAPPAQLAWLTRLSVHWVLASLPLGIAIAVLEHGTPGLQASWRRYALAVLLGAGTGSLVLALHGKFVDPAVSVTAVGFDMDLIDRFLYGMWQLVFWGSAGAMLHASSLRQRRAAAALRADELQRLRSERRLAEERLSALHAQVEPEFVLSTLSAIERLYETDPAAADRVLDALIQFLRLATPLLRQPIATIGGECGLLEAYVRTLGAATGLADVMRVELDPRIADAPVAPGTLLAVAQQLPDALSPGTDPDPLRLQEVTARLKERLRAQVGPRVLLEMVPVGPRRITLRLTLLDEEEPAHEGSQWS
jgi:hypothetical protein